MTTTETAVKTKIPDRLSGKYYYPQPLTMAERCERDSVVKRIESEKLHQSNRGDESSGVDLALRLLLGK
jgi:hypothetical protein